MKLLIGLSLILIFVGCTKDRPIAAPKIVQTQSSPEPQKEDPLDQRTFSLNDNDVYHLEIRKLAYNSKASKESQLTLRGAMVTDQNADIRSGVPLFNKVADRHRDKIWVDHFDFDVSIPARHLFAAGLSRHFTAGDGPFLIWEIVGGDGTREDGGVNTLTEVARSSFLPDVIDGRTGKKIRFLDIDTDDLKQWNWKFVEDYEKNNKTKDLAGVIKVSVFDSGIADRWPGLSGFFPPDGGLFEYVGFRQEFIRNAAK